MDEDDEDEDMDDGGDDSFGEEDDMIGVSDVTNQLAAAGWQHGVKFCFVKYITFPPPSHPHVWLPAFYASLLFLVQLDQQSTDGSHPEMDS